MSSDCASESKHPELEPPGAGIPSVEAWLVRTIGLKLITPLVSWDLARRWFQKEGETIMGLTGSRPDAQLTKRVLIPRVPGIEDSSRDWSPAMTLKHLIIVGDVEANIIVKLSRGEPIEKPVRIEEVKPEVETSPVILNEYQALLDRFDKRMAEEITKQRSPARHPHPWFGPLTAHQWLTLSAMHQRRHRKQISTILGQP